MAPYTTAPPPPSVCWGYSTYLGGWYTVAFVPLCQQPLLLMTALPFVLWLRRRTGLEREATTPPMTGWRTVVMESTFPNAFRMAPMTPSSAPTPVFQWSHPTAPTVPGTAGAWTLPPASLPVLTMEPTMSPLLTSAPTMTQLHCAR